MLTGDQGSAPQGALTDFPPPRGARSPRGNRGRSDDRGMADLLVVAGIVVFVAAMLGLIWALERV
jgi:hypothetical protein